MISAERKSDEWYRPSPQDQRDYEIRKADLDTGHSYAYRSRKLTSIITLVLHNNTRNDNVQYAMRLQKLTFSDNICIRIAEKDDYAETFHQPSSVKRTVYLYINRSS